jgi:hypothetical protein
MTGVIPRVAALAALATVLLLLAAAPARAGGYDVYACDANQGGGASPSWGLAADGGHTAYFACPASTAEHGIVTRTTWVDSSSMTPWLQGAYAIFDAPAGNVVESLHASIFLQRPSCEWSVGVWSSNGDLGGQGVYYLQPNNCGVNGIPWTRQDMVINATRVRLEVRCGAGSCPRYQTYSGGPGTAEARMRDIRVRVRDDVAPAVGAPSGSLVSGGWVGGAASVSYDASDSAGIRDTIVRVDGAEIKRNTKPCTYIYGTPCPNGGFATTIETAGIKPDGVHRFSFEAVDAGGNVNRVERDVAIDNTPPPQPVDLTLAGGEGWRAENDFDLSWKNPVEKNQAPIAGVEWQLCPSTGASCTRGSKSGQNLEKVENLEVPTPGEYELKLWLRDSAGNNDVRTAAAPLKLRVDGTAPELAFEALDPADPTLLAVRSADKGSGIAQGQIEVKSKGSQVWMPLETKIEAGRLTTRLGDEYMKDGVYELRARAVDQAANERTTQNRADGAPAEVTMPIRLKTSLRIGLKRKGRKRLRYRGAHRIRYGRPVRFNGRLRTRDRNPVADAEVLVYSQARRAGAPMRLVATLKTSRRGGFSYRAPKGVSRTIRFRYGGTPNVRSATTNVGLLVRARSTIKPQRRSFVNGETMRLRGKLRGGSIPPEGKLVELQVMLRGRFRTFATTRANRRGRWRYDYRFDGTRGKQRYRFRVRVPREATYPYETGTSRVVKVRVRGL